MKKYISGFYFSMPIQLLLLHVKKFQVLLFPWYLLFTVVGGTFMKSYGANSLFLFPEYLGEVSWLSSAIVGLCVGIFVMSWNITTFILHHKRIYFLATTAQPFLKYCINNAIIPIAFLLFYFLRAWQFLRYQELATISYCLLLIFGFGVGFFIALFISFVYFFGADRTIYTTMAATIDTANLQYSLALKDNPLPKANAELPIQWFFSAKLQLRKPRDVRHYSASFLEAIFKRHHLAAVLAIFLAIIALLVFGIFLDNPIFQVPAAASITLLLAIIIAVSGAIAVLLQSWSIPILLTLYLLVNTLYQYNIIDTRNKAYGLNYSLPYQQMYSQLGIEQLLVADSIEADIKNYTKRLDAWKAKQPDALPTMYIINVSGGGIRSANFTMHVLQALDKQLKGALLQRTALITGASGGMLGASYYRALYLQSVQQGTALYINYNAVDAISKDLLNPIFSSFISRDLLSPAKKFSYNNKNYVKDRGYAFEEKLNENTQGLLNKPMGYYTSFEDSAIIPSLFINGIITHDGRKLLMASRPARFMMANIDTLENSSVLATDAVDFNSFFSQQQASQMRFLSALRINATFPYVLPNVWLPTNPVIDVMDAGLRDNTGEETALRFLHTFEEWIKKNTRKVVLIQIRDRKVIDWQPVKPANIFTFLYKPLEAIQNNWFSLQEYYQKSQYTYLHGSLDSQLQRVTFQYIPTKKDTHASLSFHLTSREKLDIKRSIDSRENQASLMLIK